MCLFVFVSVYARVCVRARACVRGCAGVCARVRVRVCVLEGWGFKRWVSEVLGWGEREGKEPGIRRKD